MNSKNILNTILVSIMLCSLGYMFYIQSKRGIVVYGTDKVIDPFLYETGIFNDVYNGINPNSTTYHITQEELQDIKTEKIKKPLYVLIPTFLILMFANRKKKDEPDESVSIENLTNQNNKVNLSDDEELRLSFLELAIKMACPPNQVKNYYISEIISNDFEYSDLVDSEKAWRDKKQEDALIMDIKPENTPAALMERWTREFRISTFKD